MAIVAGLKAVGVFDILAQKLLMGTSGTVGVIRLLVLLCFFLSMVITNDVALITFVPLALIIVHKLPKELGNYWLLKIVAMQTIAANLGSMHTPIGNPQNLYLYARAGMSAAELIILMPLFRHITYPSSDMDTGSHCQSTSRMRFRKR